jgi:hypothetical protein
VAAASAFIDSTPLPSLDTVALLGNLRSESAAIIAGSKWVRRVTTVRVQSMMPDAFWPGFASLGPAVLEVLSEDGEGMPQLRWRFQRADAGWTLTIAGPLPTDDTAISRFILAPLDRLDESIRKTVRFQPGVEAPKVREALRRRGVPMNASRE